MSKIYKEAYHAFNIGRGLFEAIPQSGENHSCAYCAFVHSKVCGKYACKKRTGKIIRTYHLQSYNKKNMNRIRWFVIGLHLYVFPPEPEVGDIEALHNWIPQKKGIIETLKFRFHTGIWSYTAGNINYQY